VCGSAVPVLAGIWHSGMPLARMETTVAINELLDRLPDLHLDPTAPEPVINGVAFRSPPALPVEFTAACPRRHGDMTDIADGQ
jgi:hypothetical protein